MINPVVRERLLNILLADDGSLNAYTAVKLLADLPHPEGCHITALRVFTPAQVSEYNQVQRSMERTTNLLKSRHFHFHTETRLGYPVEKIIKYAGETQPDLIVMGARGASGAVLSAPGSVAMSVVRDGRWPVLMVRETSQGLRNILLVVDGSACSQVACDFLGAFPLPAEARVEVLHILEPYRPTYYVDPMGVAISTIDEQEAKRIKENQQANAEALIKGAVAGLLSHGIHAGGTILQQEDTGQAIVHYARENQVDLILCGSRGLGALTSLLLGSISEHIIKNAHCSVLVARCNSLAEKEKEAGSPVG